MNAPASFLVTYLRPLTPLLMEDGIVEVAINTGHGGSFTTIHADTAVRAIDRLALMVMATGTQMTFAEVRHYCANSIDVIIQLGRHEGRRGVAEMHFTDAPDA